MKRNSLRAKLTKQMNPQQTKQNASCISLKGKIGSLSHSHARKLITPRKSNVWQVQVLAHCTEAPHRGWGGPSERLLDLTPWHLTCGCKLKSQDSLPPSKLFPNITTSSQVTKGRVSTDYTQQSHSCQTGDVHSNLLLGRSSTHLVGSSKSSSEEAITRTVNIFLGADIKKGWLIKWH